MPAQLIMINKKMSIAKISTNTNGDGHSCRRHRRADVGAGAGGSCSCCRRRHCRASDGAALLLYINTVIHLVVRVMSLWHWPPASCCCGRVVVVVVVVSPWRLPWVSRRCRLRHAAVDVSSLCRCRCSHCCRCESKCGFGSE